MQFMGKLQFSGVAISGLPSVYVITRFFKRVNSKKIGLKIFFYLQTVYNLGTYLLLITLAYDSALSYTVT